MSRSGRGPRHPSTLRIAGRTADWPVYVTHTIGDPDVIWSRRRCYDCMTLGGEQLAARPCPGDAL